MKWITTDYDFDTDQYTERSVEVSDDEMVKLEKRSVSIICYPVNSAGPKPTESLTITYLEGYRPQFAYTGTDKALLLRRLKRIKDNIDQFIAENNT